MTVTSRSDAPAGALLTIDLGAIAANWRLMAAASGPAETAAAVKADAYGTGLVAAAGALWAAGCRTFFVALPAEGVAVRASLPEAMIYVLNGYFEGHAALYRRHRLAPVLGDLAEIDAWLGEGAGDPPPPAARPAVHVDTGINRVGLSLGAAAALAGDERRMSALSPSLVMSHFACADIADHPLTSSQIERFAAVRALFPGIRGSLANSAGIGLGAPALHDMTRPGIALYGGRSRDVRDHPVRPVATLEARVLQVRDVGSGESIGYGATAVASGRMRIAIVSCGYADGIRRGLAAAGAVAAVRGVRVPLVGRVSMDLLAVDVTGLPAGTVRRGEFVELIGPTVPLSEMADRAGTIDYEILTGLGQRFARRHVRSAG